LAFGIVILSEAKDLGLRKSIVEAKGERKTETVRDEG